MAKPKLVEAHEHRFVEEIRPQNDGRWWLELVCWPCSVPGCEEYGLHEMDDGRFTTGYYRTVRPVPVGPTIVKRPA